MERIDVRRIHFDEPIRALGKSYIGNYARSQEFVLDVMAKLDEAGVSYEKGRVLGVYFDNPQETPPDDLVCFQGLFPIVSIEDPPPGLEFLTLESEMLNARVEGDPTRVILSAYNALFSNVEEHSIVLQSQAGYQISSFSDGVVTTNVYLQI